MNYKDTKTDNGKKIGRKRAIDDPHTRKLLLQSARLGCGKEASARYAGIDPSTLYRLLEAGQNAENERDPLRIFYEEYETARAQCKVGLLAATHRSAMGGNNAAQRFLLERLYPDEFGPPHHTARGRVTVKGGGDGAPQVVTVNLDMGTLDFEELHALAWGEGPGTLDKPVTKENK